MVRTSAKLTNGSPELGQLLANRLGLKLSQADFHESPLPDHGMAVVVNTTSCPFWPTLPPDPMFT